MQPLLLLLLVAALICCTISDAANVPLTMLSDPKAKCLDGSMAGYYAQPAAIGRDKKKFVIHLNGGGECDTEAACKAQLTSPLGSSKYFPLEANAADWFLATDDCNVSSLCNWNHVFLPYCTQDLHSGQVIESSNNSFGLYFSGHHVFVSTIEALERTLNLRAAEDIVLTGASAGGIGVWYHVDYLSNRYPDARVTAATIAGHYFDATYYTGPNATLPSSMGDFRETALPATYDLYQAFVDESCKEYQLKMGRSPGNCLLSNNSFPFIESDVFVVQALTDITVLTGHDNWPDLYKFEAPEQQFMQDWYQNMTIALAPLMQSPLTTSPRKYGVFAAACYTHISFSASGPLISGQNYYQTFDNFYFKESIPKSYKLQDTCGLMCNPTCL